MCRDNPSIRTVIITVFFTIFLHFYLSYSGVKVKQNLYKKMYSYSVLKESHIKYLQIQKTKLQINFLNVNKEVKDQHKKNEIRRVEKN